MRPDCSATISDNSLKEILDMPKDFCQAAYELTDALYKQEVESLAALMRDAAKSEEPSDDPA